MSVEQAIETVIGGTDVVFVLCTSTRNRNVLRTTAFRIRSRMQKNEALKKSARFIGITNEDIDGKLYLKIYGRKEVPLYTLDADGKLVQLVTAEDSSLEDLDIIKKMVQDNISKEEIFFIMTETYGWDIDRVAEKLAQIMFEEDEPVITQDIEKREKLNREDM